MNIPLNIDWQQILLHLMNFVILAGGLYFLLYRPIKSFMDKRAAYYQDQADQAEKTTQAAQQLKADYEARLSAADDEIREEKKQAQKDAAAAAQQQLDTARAEAEKIVSDAQAMAERSREKIVRQAGQDVKDLAAEATEKLVLQSGGDAFDQFLDLAEKEAQHEQS